MFINDQRCYGNMPFFNEAIEQFWHFHNEFIWDGTRAGDMAFWSGKVRVDFLRMWCGA